MRRLPRLRSAGLDIVEAKLPDLPYEATAIVALQAEVIEAFGGLYTSGDVRKLVDERAPIQAELGQGDHRVDYVHAQRIRLQAQRAMNEFFKDYDLIVSAGFLKIAPGVTEDMDTYFSGADPVGGMGNLTGVPMVALPMGAGKMGMPVGFQLVAPRSTRRCSCAWATSSSAARSGTWSGRRRPSPSGSPR
jgi:Asp-tRNA(Asn)/Glu-tRNA(Gln) amidotransferase A subunit family amidase